MDLNCFSFQKLKTCHVNGDADKANYLLDFGKTILTGEEIKALTAENIEDPGALFSAIQKRIEGSTAARLRKDIETDVKGSASRGAFARAEKLLAEMFTGLGLDGDALNVVIEGTDDKGRFSKMVDFGRTNLKEKFESAGKVKAGDNKERLNQLLENNKVFEAKIKELQTALQEKDVQHTAALQAKENDFAVTAYKTKLFDKMYAKDNDKKLNVTRSVFDVLLKNELTEKGLTVKKEGEDFVIFKGDKALQIEGTAHNHTFDTFADHFAQTGKHYQVSNTNPNNNNPAMGQVIKPDDTRLKNIHPSVAAQITGGAGRGDHF